MQCERLLKLAKNWYLSVKDETMAPARMIQFIKDHVAACEVCLADAAIHDEIEKITAAILPESKIPKAIRLQNDLDDDDFESDEADVVEEEEEEQDTVEEEEEEEYMDDDEDLDEDLADLD